MASKSVHIRNVPAEFRLRLEARAAQEGLSISDFVLREVEKALDRPARTEILERLCAQPLRRLSRSAAEVVRDERQER